MRDLSSRTRGVVIALGIVQGLLLLSAHVLLDHKVWSVPRDIIWLLPWYAIVIAVPTALQLVLNDVRERRVWLFGLGLAAVLALTGTYAGYAIDPSVEVSIAPLVTPYVLTTLIGWYVLLPFVQACFKTGKLRPEYPDLFEFAWNNGITLFIAAIFTGIFWALLSLWAALFQVIGLPFFYHLFYHKSFVYPVTAAVFASALYLGRSNVSAVVTVRRIILAVFKGLLPLLAAIILLFLAALPFMGLEPLWATRQATALMLWLQILLLIFLNAVYQNGQGDSPYANWLRMFVRAAVVVLPVYTALCVYALYLRIDQRGWSNDRFWAVLLTFVVGLHVVGYAVAALRRSKVWMAGMAGVNVSIAAVTVALAVAVNSPMLDAKRITVASQVGRLLEGRIPAADFDYQYLRFKLGRRGNAALAQLKEIGDYPQAAAIRRGATLALSQPSPWQPPPPQEMILTAAEAAAHFSVYPPGERLDASFVNYAMSPRSPWQLKTCIASGHRCAVLAVDLNQDRRKDYVVFSYTLYRFAVVLTPVDKDWRLAGVLHGSYPQQPQSLAELEAQLSKGNYAVTDNPWRNLRIGGETRQFRPE